MIYNNILECIGNTPILRLNKLGYESSMASVLVKFEGMNAGFSIKTRTACAMLEKAEKDGKIKPGENIILEVTSGNQGIGLALVAAVKGYETIIIMPDSVSTERRKLIKHYGAQLILVKDSGNIGKCIKECVDLAKDMAENNKLIFIPQQFQNTENLAIHRKTTAKEILEQVGGPIHGFCSGIGTGGTISGVGEVLRKHNPGIEIWAVEPQNAAILSGKSVTTHLQMGIGDGIIPDILNKEIYDKICIVSDDDAIDMAKKLAKLEGLACGISGGSNVVAALALASKLGPGKIVVTILPDIAERYFSTKLFEN